MSFKRHGKPYPKGNYPIAFTLDRLLLVSSASSGSLRLHASALRARLRWREPRRRRPRNQTLQKQSRPKVLAGRHVLLASSDYPFCATLFAPTFSRPPSCPPVSRVLIIASHFIPFTLRSLPSARAFSQREVVFSPNEQTGTAGVENK